jgi:hypothetical protein
MIADRSGWQPTRQILQRNAAGGKFLTGEPIISRSPEKKTP